MVRSRKPAGRHGTSRETSGSPVRPSRPDPRWALAVGVVVCLALGAVILEHLSRPTDPTLAHKAAAGQEVIEGPVPANASASVARLTLQELLDEAHQLAARLEAITESAEALNLAGSIYESIQDADKAVDCWERTLKLRPFSPEVHFNLGYVAWQVGDFEKAKTHFLKSHAVNPGLSGLSYYLADCLSKLGEADRAIEILEGSGDLDNNQYGAKARCVLGHAYVQSEAFEKARRSFESAIVLDADSLDAHYGMIGVMMRLNEPEVAKKHRDAVARIQQIRRQPELVADRTGEFAQIANDAGYMARRLAEYCRFSAVIYSHLGREAEAQRLLRRAAALCPEKR